MFTPCSKITVGGKHFGGVHEVRVERSIFKIGAKAIIKVPVTAVLIQKDKPVTEVETAREIKVGDPVEIQLGYDNIYNLEFRGYVRQINLCSPVEIECEDAFFLTRSRSVTLQGKTTLEEVLKKCALEIGYATMLTLASFQADNKPVAWVLGKLKSDYGLALFFDIDGKVYACEPFKVVGESVKYTLRENVIKDDDLKYHRAEDVKLKIKAICIYRDGEQIEATIGASDGTEKTIYFYDVESEKELAALADAELKRHSYDGYSGKIETFLYPVAMPCMLADIADKKYEERSGRYFIEGVTVNYGRSGARRSVEIGIKL